MEICKSCDSENISVHSETEIYRYKGEDLSVNLCFSECENCKREFMTKDQILHNEMVLREAKKEFDGLLSSSELKQSRLSLGLTQEQAATLFGGGVNAFSKYERGEVTQSKALDTLVKICLSYRFIFEEIVSESELAGTSFETKLTEAESAIFIAGGFVDLGESHGLEILDYVDVGDPVESDTWPLASIWGEQLISTSNQTDDYEEGLHVA
jgi:HTH-type transcriptional regulator/antitoxin MqsA